MWAMGWYGPQYTGCFLPLSQFFSPRECAMWAMGWYGPQYTGFLLPLSYRFSPPRECAVWAMGWYGPHYAGFLLPLSPTGIMERLVDDLHDTGQPHQH